MIESHTRCGCGAEVVVKANKTDGELVVQVRTTGQYVEKRESLRDRVERGMCNCPPPGAAGLVRRCPIHGGPNTCAATKPGKYGVVELLARIAVLEADLNAEKAHADRWQKLAGAYDDIRYALRNADDTPDGHRMFYTECAELIFGEHP